MLVVVHAGMCHLLLPHMLLIYTAQMLHWQRMMARPNGVAICLRFVQAIKSASSPI